MLGLPGGASGILTYSSQQCSSRKFGPNLHSEERHKRFKRRWRLLVMDRSPVRRDIPIEILYDLRTRHELAVSNEESRPPYQKLLHFPLFEVLDVVFSLYLHLNTFYADIS